MMVGLVFNTFSVLEEELKFVAASSALGTVLMRKLSMLQDELL